MTCLFVPDRRGIGEAVQQHDGCGLLFPTDRNDKVESVRVQLPALSDHGGEPDDCQYCWAHRNCKLCATMQWQKLLT